MAQHRRLALAVLAGLLAVLEHADARAAEPADPCASAKCIEITARVRRRGDRVAVAGARVLVVAEPGRRKVGEIPERFHLDEAYVPPWIRSATTAKDGTFRVADLPPGRARLVVIGDGFYRSEQVIVVGGRVPDVFIEPVGGGEFRTVIEQRTTDAAPAAATVVMTPTEIATLPGSQGDPLRAVQSLPGVGRTPAGLGLLVLRGASPAQSKVYYGEHPLPRAFHTLGFTSVLQADVLGGLEVQASNFSSRWGNASGGVVLLAPRRGRRDGVHGFGKIDLLSAGALVEGPLRKGSFMIAAQRGYVDAALRVVEKVDPTAAFALPRYFDYQAQYDLHRGANEITARWIGSGDRWTVRYLDFDGTRQTGVDLRDQFHRGEIVVRRRVGPWRMLLTPAVRIDFARTEGRSSSSRRRAVVPSWRFEAERVITQRFSLTFGSDGSVAPYRQRTEISESEISIPDVIKARGVDANVGLYAWATLRLGNVTLWPGVRASSFARITREELRDRTRHRYAIDPRLIARWDVRRRWALRGGVGLYAQPDAVFDSGSEFIIGGEQDLGTSRVLLPAPIRFALDPGVGVGEADPTPDPLQAFQASGGGTFTGDRGFSIDATGFARFLRAPQTVSSGFVGDSIIYTSETFTRTWGAELLVRQRIGRRFYAWVGYTLMRTRVGESPGPFGSPSDVPSSFDQRHNLVLLASAELPRHFRLGARFRLTSGSPYTPVIGTILSDTGYTPIAGRQNSARFPIFHQLDVRLDRRWYLKRTTVAAYMDIQNVYNRMNVEALVYSDDYRSVISSVGLPIFPTLGVRVDW
jgi:hypothetical protein